MSAPFVPSRKHSESELDHLLRKEALWGLWQADALERMQQQDQTIDAMKARINELEKTLAYAKNSAEGVARIIAYGLHTQDPGDIPRDMCGHINIMGGMHGDPDYLKGKNTCRHTDLRSRAPRKTAKP